MRETVSRSRLRPAIGSKTCRVCALLCLIWALIGCSSQSSTSGPVLRRMLSAGRLPPCPFGPGRTTPVEDGGSEGGTRLTREGSTLEVPICPSPPLSPACSLLSTQQVGPVFATNVGSSPTWPDSTPPTSPQCFLEKPAQNGKQTVKLLFSVCVCAVCGPIGSDDGRSVGRSPRRPLRGPPRPPPHRVPVAGHISRPRDCRDRRDCVDESPAGPGPFCNRHLPLFFRCSHEQTTPPWTGLASAHPIVLH